MPNDSPRNGAAFLAIELRNNSEFLEGIETGEIRKLDGFKRGSHTVPTQINAAAESWCHRLLAPRVAEELQDFYRRARTAFSARRRDLRKEGAEGAGDLHTPAFRYSIETGQNPDDPAEYIIRRRLELRQGWSRHRAAIDDLFGAEFDKLVIEFEGMDETFDALVDKLEDIRDTRGGEVDDDDRSQRVAYRRGGVTFAFDLNRRRLEISFAAAGTLGLVDAAQQFQFVTTRHSPMLSAQDDDGTEGGN